MKKWDMWSSLFLLQCILANFAVQEHFRMKCDLFNLKRACFVGRMSSILPHFKDMSITNQLKTILCPTSTAATKISNELHGSYVFFFILLVMLGNYEPTCIFTITSRKLQMPRRFSGDFYRSYISLICFCLSMIFSDNLQT